MRIRRHIVTSRIAVHEQHPAPCRHSQFLGIHAARRQCERVRIGRIRRRCRCGVATATRRGEDEEEQDEDCHVPSIIAGAQSARQQAARDSGVHTKERSERRRTKKTCQAPVGHRSAQTAPLAPARRAGVARRATSQRGGTRIRIRGRLCLSVLSVADLSETDPRIVFFVRLRLLRSFVVNSDISCCELR